MNPESLNKFLATVRRTRFIDYLDPIGVTAQEALAQRLRWARRHLDDPKHGEEAAFLVTHAEALVVVLRTEQETDADDEWTDVFSAVNADSPLLTWMRRDDVPDSGTASAPPARAAAAKPDDALHLSRLEDITPPPMDATEVERALDEAAAGKVAEARRVEEVQAADEETSDAETLVVDRGRLGIPGRLHQRTPTPAPVARTGSPAPSRVQAIAAPTPSLRRRSVEPPPPRTPPPAPSDDAVEEEESASPVVPLLVGASALLLAAVAAALFLFGDRLAPGPVRATLPSPVVVQAPADDATTDAVADALPAPERADAVALEPPAPVALTEPEPEPVVEPVPEPEPVVAAAPEPVIAPVPAPAPAPEPLSASKSAPTPVAAPAPAAAPEPPAPRPADMPDLTGSWAGEAGGAPLRLRLQSAGGSRLSGTAEVDRPDGTRRVTVTGTWKEGRAELSGRGDALLFGYLDPTGGNGTLMIPGVDPVGWTLPARP